ncbi:hypothetical protein I8752_08330 [Nostocaceae cyanobacterium CENA369]|uniref:Uncharacterized protein n=1 Tax=Dendronalium phyllosphericum CENA369 TaxID=1725256 RepID=A0A8J7LGI8_9NOST|nr:hypothetical protein [Dendronalium phyllosphericum]MBH8573024.1 hypothetical protein [Dendronalium phyllosphericum CENA369]
MPLRTRPQYINKNSKQTLRQGLEEYYTVNSDLTHPSTQPEDFAKILLAHDASHVIYGCDTDMYDELKILALTFWTSDFKFRDWVRERQNPAVSVMYADLLKRHGWFGLYSSIIFELLRLVPELISMWLKTRNHQRFVPFLDFELILDSSLLEIRQEFELLPFITRSW